MTLPLVDRIYMYNGQEQIVCGQDIFMKVYLRTVPENNDMESKYSTENWWKFMFSAKKTGIW